MELRKKICNSCGEEKFLNEFWKNSGSPDGVRGTCAECEKTSRGSTIGTPEYHLVDMTITREEYPLGETVVVPGEPMWFSIEDGIIPLAGRGHCLVCEKFDTLFRTNVTRGNYTVHVAICNDCILKSEYGDIKYYKDDDGLFIIKRIGERIIS